MNRRHFIKTAVLTPFAILAGVNVVAAARHYPLQQLQRELQQLPTDKLSSQGSWSVSEILQHLAQSIRYSRLGYPQAKSAWFQHTAGSAAFIAFAASGQMSHPLDAPIPGAPRLIQTISNEAAMAELLNEIEQFIAWHGELAPHFAYGQLNKEQYSSAHYLHIQNHLQQISLS
ncbi:MAG: DUF1569 domain-containing protein [Gammaproteobacteria bacterium]|nr:DUF1569 domain-containing protein [Gammaproteobacteria bacterium]MBU1555739.1 DUF1569 domain-containing protein [Gammaproteobacteria bacterium]MBU2071934.1 DUF1569 domain-containing protein [Gammaproteobacteria bacterium]MBU2181795.1 DUF1569 domain-containing protein [Gammaproteobacteria bacterium]MBU2206383.1 DUF1569 domain-containing protein [Gammaproteobacteria bacterium]